MELKWMIYIAASIGMALWAAYAAGKDDEVEHDVGITVALVIAALFLWPVYIASLPFIHFYKKGKAERVAKKGE